MSTPIGPYLKTIAEACTKDLSKEVLPGDIYGIIEFGDEYGLKRFSAEELLDIRLTIVKELPLVFARKS